MVVSGRDWLCHRAAKLLRWDTGKLGPARGGARSRGYVSAAASVELGVCVWAHNDSDRNGPQVKKNPLPSKYRVYVDKTAFCFYG